MNTNKVLMAIDPGTTQSAFVVVNIDDYRILDKGKVDNTKMLDIVKTGYYDEMCIEWIASYGMPVGAEVFTTCFYVGRFFQIAIEREVVPELVFRKEVKLNLCGTTKAKDGNIRQCLLDRFGVVGTKKAPGWFHGVSKDIWAAYALACTWIDQRSEK
jgi:hypothetical protein